MWNELLNHCADFFKSLQGRLTAAAAVVVLSAVSPSDAVPRQQQVTSNAPRKQEEPKEAPRPARETPDSKEPSKTDEPRENAEKTFVLESRLTLGDGRVVRGRLRFQAPEKLRLTHEADGVQYEKSIGMGEIASIEILKWKGKFLRENKSGMVYEFAPEEFRIRLKDGHELRKTGGFFPFLKKVAMENKNGQIQVFTFWMDLKKPDGTWFTGINGPESGLRNTCHGDVVRRIDFDK